MNIHERTIRIIGEESLQKLKKSRIAVFGAGGVGGGTVEALARCGVGAIDVIDGDEFTESNLNRQLLATVDTVGKRKATTAKERILSINPDCKVNAFDLFVMPDNTDTFKFGDYDYVVDAIDNITAKLMIIQDCVKINTPLVSCMGTGNKLDASRFKIGKLSETAVCPLARVMRHELKHKFNIPPDKVTVLWSDELPVSNARPPGSISFVPPVAGMLIAGYVINKLII